MGALMTMPETIHNSADPLRPKGHPQYTDIANAPPMHLRQARFSAYGQRVVDIARITQVSSQAVYAVLANPCIVTYMETVKIDLAALHMEVQQDFQNLLPLAVERLGDVLRNNNASSREHLKAAEMVFDREHSGSFVKTSRNETTITRIVDSSAVKTSRTMAHQLGRPKEVIMISGTNTNEEEGVQSMANFNERQLMVGLIDWLCSREEVTTMSASDHRADAEIKVHQFCDANGLDELPEDQPGFLNTMAYPDGPKSEASNDTVAEAVGVVESSDAGEEVTSPVEESGQQASDAGSSVAW